MVLSPVGEGTLALGEWAGRGVAWPPVYCIWPAKGLIWPTNAFKIFESVANVTVLVSEFPLEGHWQ